MASNDTQTLIKYAAASIGVLAVGFLAYYLSKDDTEELDYNRYNVKKFEALMDEIRLEFTCIYARNYNLFLKIKENGEDDP